VRIIAPSHFVRDTIASRYKSWLEGVFGRSVEIAVETSIERQ